SLQCVRGAATIRSAEPSARPARLPVDGSNPAMRCPLVCLVLLLTAPSDAWGQWPLPTEPSSPVHPRRFGLAEQRVESIRGWYVWRKWNPQTWEAEVTKDPPGELYHIRVLPWATTYRHLAYGARPDDLL